MRKCLLTRTRNAGVANRRPYTLLRLLYQHIEKSHQLKARQPGRHIYLNVDNSPVNPEKRAMSQMPCRQ